MNGATLAGRKTVAELATCANRNGRKIHDAHVEFDQREAAEQGPG
jgi:hypothetical protein